LKDPQVVPFEQLKQEPYASVLCFPKPSEPQLQTRLQELQTLGVTALEFSGKASLFGVGLPVLGKGFVGIVVTARMGGKKVAIKIRRTDADRADLFHEAQMLTKANSVNVAPHLVGASKNFLVLELVEGKILPDWLMANRDGKEIKQVLKNVLEQCFRLDKAGLDHGELSKAPKHILVDKIGKPYIVDFETASTERKVANVTAVCQYLFLGESSASKTIAEIIGEMNQKTLRDTLKTYKQNKSRENFDLLMYGLRF